MHQVAPVREQLAMYRMSFAFVHHVLREVCVRFRYLLPFPSLSHRFDNEIREDRATQEVNPFITMSMMHFFPLSLFFLRMLHGLLTMVMLQVSTIIRHGLG